MVLYDSLGGYKGLKRHRHLTKRGALKIAPGAEARLLVGGIQYYDAQVDDARHTLAVARTAASYGAAVASNAPVVGFLREGEHVTGVRVRDLRDGPRDRGAAAGRSINATGVWTDDVQAMIGERGKFQVRASKGVHLVVPRDRLQLETGLILRTEKSVLFVIPWGRHWIIGTTDTDWELDKAHPAASSTDIDYVLEQANRVLSQPLSPRGRRGRLRRPAAAAGGRVGEHQQAVARAHGRRARARADRRGRRQVHDLPGDGARRGRRGRARAGAVRAAVGDARHRAGRRRGLPRAVEPARADGARQRAAHQARRAPAAPLRVADPRAAGA